MPPPPASHEWHRVQVPPSPSEAWRGARLPVLISHPEPVCAPTGLQSSPIPGPHTGEVPGPLCGAISELLRGTAHLRNTSSPERAVGAGSFRVALTPLAPQSETRVCVPVLMYLQQGVRKGISDAGHFLFFGWEGRGESPAALPGGHLPAAPLTCLQGL